MTILNIKSNDLGDQSIAPKPKISVSKNFPLRKLSESLCCMEPHTLQFKLFNCRAKSLG